MAKKKSAPRRATKSKMTWHFFLPTAGGFLIAWLFSQSVVLSVEVGVVVLICSYLAVWLKDK